MKNFIRNRLFGRFHVVTANSSDAPALYRFLAQRVLSTAHGVLEYENGGVYEGNFNMGAKHGLGVSSSASGFRYVGDWARWQTNRIGQNNL